MASTLPAALHQVRPERQRRAPRALDVALQYTDCERCVYVGRLGGAHEAVKATKHRRNGVWQN